MHEPHAPPAGREYLSHARYTLRWLLLVLPVATITGSLVALFLWSLDWATRTRLAYPALLWFLPAAGAMTGVLYVRAGKGVERGHNLIVDEIHTPGDGVPTRMAPLVLAGTLITHLFGGSAGREGTAVQMGGSIASTMDRLFFARLRGDNALRRSERAVLLQAGIAAGFSAVFGTPIAGTVFALEVLSVGRLSYAGLIPCLMAAVIGNWTTTAWGIQHTLYPVIPGVFGQSMVMLLPKVACVGIVAGVVSMLFAESTHALARSFTRYVRVPWVRPIIGGSIMIGMTLVLGTRDYLGLGVSSESSTAVTIVSAFRDGGAAHWSWLLKGLFTAVTLASGFKGGEVTPLFFIGATLGNALAGPLDAPVELFAAIGFVAVFAGATNTPLACTLMGLELFGAGAAVYIAAACFLAYLFSGRSSVYSAQRISVPKGDLAIVPEPRLVRPELPGDTP